MSLRANLPMRRSNSDTASSMRSKLPSKRPSLSSLRETAEPSENNDIAKLSRPRTLSNAGMATPSTARRIPKSSDSSAVSSLASPSRTIRAARPTLSSSSQAPTTALRIRAKHTSALPVLENSFTTPSIPSRSLSLTSRSTSGQRQPLSSIPVSRTRAASSLPVPSSVLQSGTLAKKRRPRSSAAAWLAVAQEAENQTDLADFAPKQRQTSGASWHSDQSSPSGITSPIDENKLPQPHDLTYLTPARQRKPRLSSSLPNTSPVPDPRTSIRKPKTSADLEDLLSASLQAEKSPLVTASATKNMKRELALAATPARRRVSAANSRTGPTPAKGKDRSLELLQEKHIAEMEALKLLFECEKIKLSEEANSRHESLANEAKERETLLTAELNDERQALNSLHDTFATQKLTYQALLREKSQLESNLRDLQDDSVLLDRKYQELVKQKGDITKECMGRWSALGGEVQIELEHLKGQRDTLGTLLLGLKSMELQLS